MNKMFQGKLSRVKDLKKKDFEKKLSVPQRTKVFAYRLLKHLISTDILGKTIVFCVNQEHALDMAKYCNEAFKVYKKKFRISEFDDWNYSVRITGNDKQRHGYPDLDKFRNVTAKKRPVVVTTSKLLTTGVDIKDLRNVVIFRNVKSKTEMKQIIGRGTRIFEHKNEKREKLGFYILEFANRSIDLFNDPDWDGDLSDWNGEIEEVEEEVIVNEQENSESQKIKEPELTAEELENIKFRMDEEYGEGQIHMLAEQNVYLDDDGKPINKDTFIKLQEGKLNEAGLSDFKSFHKKMVSS